MVREFVVHYHGERNHQGLGNELIAPSIAASASVPAFVAARLGGLLRYYHHAA